MDLQKLESQIAQVISDDQSTEDCQRKFESHLGDIEQRGEGFISKNLLRVRNYLNKALLQVADEQEKTNPAYADSLRQLCHQISSVDKKTAPGLVASTRKKLRSNFPDLKLEDDIKTHFEAFFLPELREKLKQAIQENNIEQVKEVANELHPTDRSYYFRVMSELNPEEPKNATSFAKCAYKLGTPEEFLQQLEQIKNPETKRLAVETYAHHVNRDKYDSSKQEHQKTAVTLLEKYLDTEQNIIHFAVLARAINDTELMTKALMLLEKHLDNLICLKHFARIAKQLGFINKVYLALEKIEEFPFKDSDIEDILTTYGVLTRMIFDRTKMFHAMKVLKDHVHNSNCLNTYAALAKDLRDEDEMIEAFFLLADRLHDPISINTFATLARRLKDPQSIQDSFALLEPHLGEETSAHTYAKNALNHGTENQVKIAIEALEKYQGNANTGSLINQLVSKLPKREAPPISGEYVIQNNAQMVA